MEKEVLEKDPWQTGNPLIKGGGYDPYMEFIRRYEESGYEAIDRKESFIKSIEAYAKKNNQFFTIADFIKINILWTSARCLQIIGVPPEQLDPYLLFEATHKEDKEKHASGRVKVFEIVNNLFVEKKGEAILSANLRIRNGEGKYNNLLFQAYMFYSSVKHTVFMFEVHTVINSFDALKQGSHYYCGNNISNFRYPDKDLLKIGSLFSKRELQIIKMIDKGLTSEEIANVLFLSKYTVNTHRTNILRKSGCRSFAELIHRFREINLI